MSRARVIEIHRAIARLHEELAEELAHDDAANDVEHTDDSPAPKARRRRPIPLVKPTGRVKPSDLDKKRADTLLKRHYGR